MMSLLASVLRYHCPSFLGKHKFGMLVNAAFRFSNAYSPGAKVENGGLPYTESPLSFDGFN